MSRCPQRRVRFCVCDDRLLERLIAQFGTSSWDRVADALPGRTARQCRERCKHYLSGRQAAWTAEEDDFLWQKVAEIGPKWTRISALMANRTDYQAKTRWKHLYRLRRRGAFRSAHTDGTPRRRSPAPENAQSEKKERVKFAGIEELLRERCPPPPAPRPEAPQDGYIEACRARREFAFNRE